MFHYHTNSEVLTTVEEDSDTQTFVASVLIQAYRLEDSFGDKVPHSDIMMQSVVKLSNSRMWYCLKKLLLRDY